MRGKLIRKFHTCFRLSPQERRLAVKTVGWVAFVRLGLWLLSFRRMQRAGESLGRCRQRRDGTGIREIVWAVRLASRYVPRATCLTQALATQILSGRNGHAVEVHIGVALDEQRGFRAHAWVESEGKVLIGGSDELDGYAPMLVLDGKKRVRVNTPQSATPRG